MNKNTYRELNDGLIGIAQVLEKHMWELHKKLGGNYESKLIQLNDAKELGKYAKAIDFINKARSEMSDIERG